MSDVKDSYSMDAHNFNLKVGAYQYCSKCGLVANKNEFSQWAIKMGCNHKLHASYNSKRSLSNPFLRL